MTDFTLSQVPAPPGPELRELTVGGLLREAAADAPDVVALVEGVPGAGERRSWTYADLLRDAEALARALSTRFEKGERLAVWAPNVPEWILLEYACGLAGIVLVTVNPAFRRDEVAYVLGQSRAAGVVVMPEFRGNPMQSIVTELQADLPELREVIPVTDVVGMIDGADPSTPLPEVTPSDPAQIQYTSGTTGFPKGALLHHRGIVNDARLVADRANPPERSAWGNPMPLFHTGGCVLGALGSAWKRCTQVLVLAFDPALVLELVETYRVTITGAVPTMLIAMMEHPDFQTRDLSSLRVVISGGSTVPEVLVRRIEDVLGVDFTIVFGQTECSPVATMTSPTDTIEDKSRTLGTSLPHVENKIVDPMTGDVVPVGTVGEFCTRGFHVMDGYFELPEATAEAIDADGWLHTGDLAAMDARGYFTIEGRLKDMIIRGGENIYPKEIEEVLYRHPTVAEVAVIGLPDERWGERVAAVVRTDGDVATNELFEFCREHLAPHKAPRDWFFVEAFPLTGSGKIQKYRLQEMVAEGELAPA